jgi:hypothetical protein
MRAIMVIVAILLLPASGYAQSRPAPDTPGEPRIADPPAQPQPALQMVDALRVLAVTSGVIGGFVAADIISGGLLTGPLLRGLSAVTRVARTAPSLLELRPVMATNVERPALTEPANLRHVLGRSLSPSSVPASVGRL